MKQLLFLMALMPVIIFSMNDSQQNDDSLLLGLVLAGRAEQATKVPGTIAESTDLSVSLEALLNQKRSKVEPAESASVQARSSSEPSDPTLIDDHNEYMEILFGEDEQPQAPVLKRQQGYQDLAKLFMGEK